MPSVESNIMMGAGGSCFSPERNVIPSMLTANKYTNWSSHCECIVHKAREPLYCVVLKVGGGKGGLARVYSSVIRSVVEYATPVLANLPHYLSLFIESVQKKL